MDLITPLRCIRRVTFTMTCCASCRRENTTWIYPRTCRFCGGVIEVCERVVLAPQLWELFASELDQIDYQQIMSLQNKLPIAFECFQAKASFCPEQSFEQISVDESMSASRGDARNVARDMARIWLRITIPGPAVPSINPCSISGSPQPIDNPLHGASPMQKIFLERNSSQWWLSPEGLQSIRDYFILKDHKGRCSWAYCNQDGSWFKQGEF